MSAIFVLALVLALAIAAVVVFVAVVVSIHSEPRDQMTVTPQGPLAAMVRRLLGVYVGRPGDAGADGNREECLTGNSAEWWSTRGWD